LKDIVPTALAAVTAGKTLYGLPTVNYTQGLIINRVLFKQAGLDPDHPPTTWAEVEADAKAITKLGHGIFGYGDYSAGNNGGWHFSSEVFAEGGQMINPAGTAAAFNSDEGKAVLQALQSGPIWLPIAYFDLWMLRLLGFLPALDECIECGEPLAGQPAYFHALRDGLVCARHRHVASRQALRNHRGHPESREPTGADRQPPRVARDRIGRPGVRSVRAAQFRRSRRIADCRGHEMHRRQRENPLLARRPQAARVVERTWRGALG
jgi:hypothetical protein